MSSLPPRRPPLPARTSRTLLLTGLVCSLGMPAGALAQQAADGELQSVVVTGTYAKNRRTVDSESPIDIIGARELNSTGSTELATVLGRLLPSVNFPRPTGADASDAVRPAQLRGLSPDQVLVLVNGKRRHTSAVVNVNGTQGRGSAPADLNAIPLAAIDHVEVLRDGAAAQYGSDAIAGVINIILKKGAAGGELEAGFGEYQERDGKQTTLRGSAGFALGDKGWVRVAAELVERDATNRAGADLRNPNEPRYGRVNQRYGDPDSKPRSAFANAQYRLGDDVDWYAFAGYSERDTSAAATWRAAFDAKGNVQTPLFPEGFLPLQNSTLTDQSVVTGLRGETAGWRWDASVNHGGNRFELALDNTANLSLGAASPTHFYAGQLKTTQTLLNLDVAREFAVAPFSGPLTVAVGAEARRERYAIGAGDAASYSGSGSAGFSGFRPANAGGNSRHNSSLYLNLEAEISQQWSGAAALRHERYSDFGNTTSAKVSSRYAFNDAVSLRGTASSGFRAPSLAQQFYTITSTNFFAVGKDFVPVETGTFAVNSAAARALGAQPLKAEKARNLSLGLQWQPTRNVSATADLYRIDIDERIVFSSNLVLKDDLKTRLAAQGATVGAARYFTNAVDTRTHGVDLVGTYRIELRETDRVDLTLAYNRNKTSVQRVAANPALLSANGLLLVDRQSINRITVASPKDKLSLAGDYVAGAWNAHAALTRYGSFTVPQNNPAIDQVYDPQWVLDLAGSAKLDRHWKLTAGVDNVTNRYPQQVTAQNNLNLGGTQPYSVFAPNGFNGRYFYAKAGYAW